MPTEELWLTQISLSATQQAQISEKKANALSRRFVSYIFQYAEPSRDLFCKSLTALFAYTARCEYHSTPPCLPCRTSKMKVSMILLRRINEIWWMVFKHHCEQL